MPPEKTPKTFIEHIQAHERSWGNQNYPNRPDLASIISAQVVVFWESVAQNPVQSGQYTITLYEDFTALEAYLARLIVRSNVQLPKDRIAMIFSGGKSVKIEGVKIKFEVDDK